MAAKSSKKAKKRTVTNKPAASKKKAITKKPVGKKAKPSLSKPVAKKKVVKKAAPKKAVSVVKKSKPVAAAKKVPVKLIKKAAPSTSSTKPIIRTGPSKPPLSLGKSPLAVFGRGSATPARTVKEKPLTKSELDFFKDLLLKLRDRVIDEISFLANDNLNRSAKDSSGDLSSYSFHMADQGTDNFDREFAASLLNNEHDVLYEIEEALRRIEQGTYGICEMSEKVIERERLKVIPFARYCVSVQSEMERGKPRFRPFRRTSIQTADTSST